MHRRKSASRQSLEPNCGNAQPSARKRSGQGKRFISDGEIFRDGAIIEPVAGSAGAGKPDLLLWTRSKAKVGSRVEHGGCVYEAAELPPSLYRATRFPSHCRDYGSARSLFDSMSDLSNRYLDLPELVCSPPFPSAPGWLIACRSRQL